MKKYLLICLPLIAMNQIMSMSLESQLKDLHSNLMKLGRELRALPPQRKEQPKDKPIQEPSKALINYALREEYRDQVKNNIDELMYSTESASLRQLLRNFSQTVENISRIYDLMNILLTDVKENKQKAIIEDYENFKHTLENIIDFKGLSDTTSRLWQEALPRLDEETKKKLAEIIIMFSSLLSYLYIDLSVLDEEIYEPLQHIFIDQSTKKGTNRAQLSNLWRAGVYTPFRKNLIPFRTGSIPSRTNRVIAWDTNRAEGFNSKILFDVATDLNADTFQSAVIEIEETKELVLSKDL